MNSEEYREICDQTARDAIRYAAWAAADEVDKDDGALDDHIDHWVDVFLDEHPPEIAPADILAMTSNREAYAKDTGYPAPSLEVAAIHAFQADVWDAINTLEVSSTPEEEVTVARGMLRRYRTAEIAIEMAHWHAMDHAAGSPSRDRWQRVGETIRRLAQERSAVST